MTGRLPRNTGSIIRSLGQLESRDWEAVKEDLFVDEAYGQSWAEVFPVDLLLPSRESLDFAADDPSSWCDDRPTKSEAVAEPDIRAASAHDDTILIQLTALQSAADIADYVEKTSVFRAFFVRQMYSWGPLLVTNSLFCELMLQARLPSSLKNAIAFFGAREREVEVSPPALRFEWLSMMETYLNRGHECTYGLRFVERNGRATIGPLSRAWSFRQCAISCRYVPQQGGSSWAFVTISASMQRSLDTQALAGRFRHEIDPFEVHQLIIDSAISSWRLYLIDLTEETDKRYAQTLGMSPTDNGPVSLHAPGQRQELLILDERLLNAMLAITATMDTSSALSAAWESGVATIISSDQAYIDLMRSSFEQHRRCLRLLAAELVHLRTKLAGSTSLLSSFLDLSSGYSLQNLAQESSKENEEMRRLTDRMHKLAEKSTQDAAAVKVLTILTLIYLPVTVVSNFFSTSFVNSTTSTNGFGNITVTDDWWILFAASVPLTVLTIYIWLVWTRIQANPHGQAWWKYALGTNFSSSRAGHPTSHDSDATAKPEHRSHDGRPYKEQATDIHGRMLRRTSSGLC